MLLKVSKQSPPQNASSAAKAVPKNHQSIITTHRAHHASLNTSPVHLPAVCEHVVVNEETSGHIAVEQRLMRENEFVFRRWVEGGAQKRFIVVPPELNRRAESAARMRWS